METRRRLRMPLTPREAIELQQRLRHHVLRKGTVRPRTVAGVDVAFAGGRARAAVVVTRDLEPVEQATAEAPLAFPYVPGLLSFRELPAILAAWRKLTAVPDVAIVDGQGYAHPRRLGIASHLGILLDRPTIGCAKSRLVGTHEEPPPGRGAWSPLVHHDEVIGAALRTQHGRGVVFVSVGHRLTLACAIRIILACAPRYRLPDPQRFADQLSKGRALAR